MPRGSLATLLLQMPLLGDFGAIQEVCEGGLDTTVFEQSQRAVWNDEAGRFDQG